MNKKQRTANAKRFDAFLQFRQSAVPGREADAIMDLFSKDAREQGVWHSVQHPITRHGDMEFLEPFCPCEGVQLAANGLVYIDGKVFKQSMAIDVTFSHGTVLSAEASPYVALALANGQTILYWYDKGGWFRFFACDEKVVFKKDRTTLWISLALILGIFIALGFGDAGLVAACIQTVALFSVWFPDPDGKYSK